MGRLWLGLPRRPSQRRQPRRWIPFSCLRRGRRKAASRSRCANCASSTRTRAAGKAQMVLLDIPDEGGFYVWDNADGAALNEEAVRAFTAAYSAKTLKRQQLG